MIQQRMNEWIRHPEQLNAESLCELRELLQRFPYFQTAWILYLKNLFLLHDASFESELKRGALYVADLSVLFYSIEGERFVIQKHPEAVAENRTSDRTLDLIDRFLSKVPEQSHPSKDLPLPADVSIDYTSVLMAEEDSAGQEAKPLRGQALIDSFIAHEESAEAGEKKADAMQESAQMSEASASFSLENDTERKAGIVLETEDSSADAWAENQGEENYFTETLAKIYIKQRRYDKALEIIKKLNLEYPQKNIYFADQIRFLEKLIINAKSK